MAITTDAYANIAERTGIGLRLPHIAEVMATRPNVGWLEIHPENFLANPHATELLLDLAHDYPISVHTVGISIGSVEGVNAAHLNRLRAFIERLNPAIVSGHLAWSTQQAPISTTCCHCLTTPRPSDSSPTNSHASRTALGVRTSLKTLRATWGSRRRR